MLQSEIVCFFGLKKPVVYFQSCKKAAVLNLFIKFQRFLCHMLKQKVRCSAVLHADEAVLKDKCVKDRYKGYKFSIIKY